ncbi:nectin-1 isoform X1 [Girardinichthys multiradiatus]|uniref:nectin-1 isoform X1 n=1 Tax=Girardinichthys multiradiatus TaxID=208333 RepID=UPI001FAC3C93|nr:nectin-1 isoform X1 [Girardinichthys multiradiatus]
MSYKLVLFVFALVRTRDVQDVAGQSATADLRGTAILPCKLTRKLTTDEVLEQISWQRKTKGKPQTDNFLTITKEKDNFVNGHDKRFQRIGTFADNNGTLRLSDVNLQDDGTYSCIFSIFPTGTVRMDIPLHVLVTPKTSIDDALPRLGEAEVPLATCTSAGSKPPAKVAWDTGALKDKVRATNNSTLHDNGTTTTVSTLMGKPTKEIYRRRLQCVISTEKLNTTISFEIQIYFCCRWEGCGISCRLYMNASGTNQRDIKTGEKKADPPLEVNITEGPMKDQVTCEADANPKADITWHRSDNPLLPSVTAEGATLTFKSKTSDLTTGSYQCKAINRYGSKESTLYVQHRGSCKDGWIAFSLLLAIVAIMAIVAAVALYKHGVLKLPRLLVFEREQVPTSSPAELAGEDVPDHREGGTSRQQNAEV